MAIEDENSLGDLDIYVSFKDRKTGQWSVPLNLGPDINTHFKEDYPYLSPDGKNLFFTSTGYIGFGGEDIYVSQRIGNSWTSWTKPLNLGPLVNTKSDDFGFSLSSSGNEAYYNSPNFDSDSNIVFDCYKVSLPKTLRYEPFVEIVGTISSIKDTSIKIQASVHMKKHDGMSEYISNSDPKTGYFDIKVPGGYPYIVTVDNDNYFTKQENMFVLETGIEYVTKKNFQLVPLPDSGQSFTINKISFYPNTPIPTEESLSSIDSLAQYFKQLPDAHIQISVFTDNKGDLNKLKLLSIDRAKELVCILGEKGVKFSKISIVGYGPEKPIADNNTEQGRKINNRIEIQFLSKVKKEDDFLGGIKN
jgi:outer membrane protein OmpA-like peptidoglycan-associated protein